MSTIFTAFMNQNITPNQSRYPIVKAQHPTEGRRKWRLRVAQEFWNSLEQGCDPQSADDVLNENVDDEDTDPLDNLIEGEEPGILVRTDFSNEENWELFLAKFRLAEQELADALKSTASEAVQGSDITMEDEDANEDSDDDKSSDSESAGAAPQTVVQVLNPESPHLKSLFDNRSNLAVLRLLNDVDIRKAPTPPRDAKPLTPSSRLTGRHGCQEIYYGKNIWIYDAQSNVDGCVRAVNQTGDIYGTASGDSWRARVTHICELQFNMSFLGMKIDFGGLDRWDYAERLRNLKDADIEII